VSECNRRFEDHLDPPNQESRHLKRLIALEDFIEFSGR